MIFMFSIYHFFKSLVLNKQYFSQVKKLDGFPFDESMLSSRRVGVFPDMAIKLNKDKSNFTGGELIELKDSISYSVSSFNSTIPTKLKDISRIISGEKSSIYKQMEDAGNDVYSLPIRDVFYLIRGRRKEHTKVCLVSGAFFETIKIGDLISDSFMQVLNDNLKDTNTEISQEVRTLIHKLFSEQENFSKVRTVDKASVKLRFRIMTEVKAEGNILNPKKYPEIEDDTLNFLLPCDNAETEKSIMINISRVFNKKEVEQFKIFKLKHYFNGSFLVFQTSLY